jgi:succinyl-CoA synthetase beta subunit
MKVHEYQAKEIFRQAGIPVPREVVCATPAECAAAARDIGLPVIIKAQVLVGGRGRAGGVRKVERQEDVERVAGQILGMVIKGLPVEKVLVAECADIRQEFYVGIVVDRVSRRPVLMASAAGGVEIEQVARETPEKILKVAIDPGAGFLAFQGRNVGMALFGNDPKPAREFAAIAAKLYRAFTSRDCSLIEINPLVRLGDGSLLALDAKVNFDDNALFRHKDNEALRDPAGEEPKEVEAKAAGLSYIRLDGNVGCVVNGAGLAMATMDLIKRYGGEPANFLDVGGSSSSDKMVTAMRIILSDPKVKAILVNIFGGITRCDDIAAGLLAAKKQADIRVPVVARLTGTNAEPARVLLEGTDVTPAATMAEAVKKAVELAGGGR